MPPRLSLHTITTKPWSPHQCIDHYSKAGISGITFWREDFESTSPKDLGQAARDAGLEVTSLACGGNFPAPTEAERDKIIDENFHAIDQAAECGAPTLVLVCGSRTDQSLAMNRGQIIDGIAECLDHAASMGVILAIEPLHPIYADTRSAVNTMRYANHICEVLGHHESVGIACDVHHTWWDPDLLKEIETAIRAGDFASFHISDWKSPTTDRLHDRGLPGEGCIPIKEISDTISASGFKGFTEIEVFSEHHWARPQEEVLQEIITNCAKIYGS